MNSRHPTLDELTDRLSLNGVKDDPLRVASAILGLARANDWAQQPQEMAEWIERLAIEIGNMRPAQP